MLSSYLLSSFLFPCLSPLMSQLHVIRNKAFSPLNEREEGGLHISGGFDVLCSIPKTLKKTNKTRDNAGGPIYTYSLAKKNK